MKKNLWILSCLLLFNAIILCDLSAAGGRGGGGGGRSGAGGGGRSGGGGHSIQRSPSMSRSSGTSRQNVSRPSTNMPQQGNRNISRPASTIPQADRQRDSRNQVQQFIKNNPSQQTGAIQAANGRNFGKNGNISNTIGKNVQRNVNNNYPNRGSWFNSNFFDNHHYNPPYYNNHANWWGAATAIGIGSWLGWQAQPYYYGYNDGYYGPAEYNSSYSEMNYQVSPQQNMAEANVTGGNWMPLGVFSISNGSKDEITPNMFLQLALNKDGTISGTFYNTTTNEVYELEGEVDSSTKRAFWKIVDNKDSPVVETGIYNLTQDIVPILIHFSNGLTQNKVLIRVNNA